MYPKSNWHQEQLIQCPTFAKIKTVSITATTAEEINGYHYLLGNPLQNDSPLTYFFFALKRFYHDTSPGCAPLGIAFSKSSGLNIMTYSYSIESLCSPTCHKLDVVKTDDTEKSYPSITILSDTDFATKINFLVDGATFTDTFPYPEDTKTINTDLYRVINQPFDKSTNPIRYNTFNPRMHVAPNVLWFQPYNKSSQSIEISLTAGFKIIQNELDGLIIPLPDISEDLISNNSLYLQGSIDIKKVNRVHTIIRSDKRLSIHHPPDTHTHLNQWDLV